MARIQTLTDLNSNRNVLLTWLQNFSQKYLALTQLFKIKISAVELDHPVVP